MRKLKLKIGFVGIWILCLIFRNEMLSAGESVGNFDKLVGCVVEEPDVRSEGSRYVFDFENFFGKVLVYAPRYPVYEYGDCLLVFGSLSDPENRGNFDYVNYLKRYGIYKIMYSRSMELIDEKSGNFFFKIIYDFKITVEDKLNSIFSEPYKSFMGGLLMGSRKGLPDRLEADFKKAGLTHIMAISGYNITLVIVMISGLFWFLRRNLRVFVSGFFVVVFVIFVGMSASAVRAAVMGILGLLALRFERKYEVERGLFVTVFLMGLFNPLILVYDSGFQLSILATGGLVYIYPRLKNYFKNLPNLFGLGEIFLGTLSAQIAVLPIMILNFRQISLLGVFANVLVLPLIPVVMLLGFCAVIFGFLSMYLAFIPGFLAYVLMKIILFIVEGFAKIPFVSVEF